MHRSWAYAAAFVAALQLSACGGGRERNRSDKKPTAVKTTPTTDTTPTTKGATVAPVNTAKEIVVHMESEPTHFNYLLRQDAWTSRIVFPKVQEMLIREDPYSYQIQPLLAEKFELATDGTKITFTLRENVKWHDGQPFTSA